MGSSTSDLLHDVGHDLMTLSLLVVAVRDDPELPERTRARVGLIEKEIDRLRDLVGGAQTTPEAVSVRAVLTEVVDPLALTVPAELTVPPGPDLTLAVDPGLLCRLVANLVGNAVRAAGPGGHVEVDLADAPVPAIEVRDDGPGPGCGPPGSRGRGLAIVHLLAARCGAEVTLAPRRGGGTTARVVFRPAEVDRGGRRGRTAEAAGGRRGGGCPTDRTPP